MSFFRTLMSFQKNALQPQWHGYILVVMLALCYLVRSFCNHHSNHVIIRTALKIQAGAIAQLYRKVRRVLSFRQIKGNISTWSFF